MKQTFNTVGKDFVNPSWNTKATGQYRYISDLSLAGMLVGKVLRSPHPHARILNIDTLRASRLPGVRAVLTAADAPGIPFCFGPQRPNMLPLQKDRVRFIGDQVAAVAAVDEETAMEALSLIRVDYEELPAVFDPLEAMKPDAPRIHDEEGNISFRVVRTFGDLEKGFKEADEIFEDTYSTHSQTHCCLETRCSIAEFDASGRVTVWTTTQISHPLRFLLAQAVQLPLSSIRVVSADMGGGFGERLGMDAIEPITVLLARKAGKPVRILRTREEEFATARGRYPMKVTLKTGVKRNGKLVARHARIICDNGAYNHHGLAVMGAASAKIALLYAIPHVSFEALLVYTNNSYGGPFRGYGNPQITFAMESQMDRIARDLGIDRVAIRLHNATRTGQTTAAGGKVMSCGLEECIRAVGEKLNWKKKGSGKVRAGTGMAAMAHTGSGAKMFFGSDYNSSSAVVHVDHDGSIIVSTGAAEMGQGISVSLIQIAAEELGMPPEMVRLVMADTDATPHCAGAFASRQVSIAGEAVRRAAEDARRQIVQLASEQFRAGLEAMEFREGKVYVKGSPDKGKNLTEIAKWAYFDRGKVIIGRGLNEDPNASKPDMKTGYGNISSSYTFAAQGAEVEVNLETGRVRVVRMVAAHDVGKAISPAVVEGQIEGALAQGIGFALSERLEIQNGQLQNPNLLDYAVPFAGDLPAMEVTLVEAVDPYGPFGAKGIGEPGLVPTAAAIANAVEDATGIRIRELPITPEKILKAWEEMKKKEKQTKSRTRKEQGGVL
jgi:xanthine dehydrogenase molybdenum-binding subunit